MQAVEIDNERTALEAQADVIRRSGVLGRSMPMQSLFDYLLKASIEGRAPKEQEIAFEVFGRDPDFDPVQDAVVRVYVHKLRKSLSSARMEDVSGQQRLMLPRGQYRLMLATAEEAPANDDGVEGARVGPWRWSLMAGALLIALVAIAVTWAFMRPPPQQRALDAVRASAPWAALIGDGLPTTVVLGDYYLLGESDDGTEVARLVREFDINSEVDLENHLLNHPDQMGRYIDMDLRYLPVAAGPAMARIMPVLGRMADERQLSVILASQLTPDMIKTTNIVYVGYFSGLRGLADRLFAGSRFAIGGSFDEILDRKSGRQYISQAAIPSGDAGSYTDYGLLSAFPGPGHNRIIVIAGMRDTAVKQLGEMLTRTDALRDIADHVGKAQAFEALYEVAGMRQTNVSGKLLTAAPLDAGRIWSMR
jgi:hypothetical protein